MTEHPVVTRHYLNHHLDSSRWEIYKPRADDVIVTTSYKCGTTMTQQILFNLLVRNTFDDEVFPPMDEASPWLDARHWGISKAKLGELVENLPGRRFLKSHLPLDGLPYFEQVKYLVVARDPRDVFMSLLNHYGAYTEHFLARLNTFESAGPFPPFDGDARGFWREWITRGWFDWEQEGYPFWSNMWHTQSYWNYRHLPNFLFLHYADMTRDTPGAISRIAEFIGHDIADEEIQAVARAVSFKRVKAQAEAESARGSDQPESFRGGQATFINKGTNGRWRDLLTADDLVLYEQTRDQVLTSDCANWLEQGGPVS